MDARVRLTRLTVFAAGGLGVLLSLYVVSYPLYLRWKYPSDTQIWNVGFINFETIPFYRPIQSLVNRSEWASGAMEKLTSLANTSKAFDQERWDYEASLRVYQVESGFVPYEGRPEDMDPILSDEVLEIEPELSAAEEAR